MTITKENGVIILRGEGVRELISSLKRPRKVKYNSKKEARKALKQLRSEGVRI